MIGNTVETDLVGTHVVISNGGYYDGIVHKVARGRIRAVLSTLPEGRMTLWIEVVYEWDRQPWSMRRAEPAIGDVLMYTCCEGDVLHLLKEPDKNPWL